VDVRTRGIRRAVDPRTIRRRAIALLGDLGLGAVELSVLLCTDEEIRSLNATYRGIDAPTDVLSFSLGGEGDELAGGQRMLGDIVVSVETARTQARARGRALVDELTWLLIHGLLHLLGHDHETAADGRTMDALARQLAERFRPRR